MADVTNDFFLTAVFGCPMPAIARADFGGAFAFGRPIIIFFGVGAILDRGLPLITVEEGVDLLISLAPVAGVGKLSIYVVHNIAIFRLVEFTCIAIALAYASAAATAIDESAWLKSDNKGGAYNGEGRGIALSSVANNS